tara:strand:- start:48 stop:305 length:258 start_codon:yes stop_codon:yes gene_type:complete
MYINPKRVTGTSKAACKTIIYAPATFESIPNKIRVATADASKVPIPPPAVGIEVARFDTEVNNIDIPINSVGETKLFKPKENDIK